MEAEDGTIHCDQCKGRSAESEQAAKDEGWLIDKGATPTVHFCPECREKISRRAS